MPRWLRWVLGGLVAIALLIGALLFTADTDFGRRLIAQQIASQSPRSGLRIKIGKIEGSIFGDTILHDLELHDPQGRFFAAPEVRLDWQPFLYLRNRVDIDSLTATTATLYRLPKLRPGAPDAPILPDFDIRIGRLSVERVIIRRAVAGEDRIGRIDGSADIRAGRAMVKLTADADRGDRLVLSLDAAPDADRFDISAGLNAPSGGVFGALIGTTKPLTIGIAGDGRWQDWKGRLIARSGTAALAALDLTAQSGRYGLSGGMMPGAITSGRIAQLGAPMVRVRGDATLKDRRLDSTLRLRSDALAVDVDGVIDLGRSAFDNLLIETRLLRAATLVPGMTGSNVVLKARLDGTFANAAFDYLLTAPRVAFGTTGLDGVRASGQGRLGSSPVRVPIRLSAQRITGLGDVAGGILRNISVEGVLLASQTTLIGNDLRLRSDKLTGKLAVFVDLATGRYDIGLEGQLGRYLIPGLGIVDVRSQLKVVPGPGGKGFRVVGQGQAFVRRLDNGFLASLAGGLPRIDTGLERGPDGVLYLKNLRLTAPALSITGDGYRRLDGTFFFEGSGRQRSYGPLTLKLDGQIDRPRLDIVFASPNAALGLSNVRLQLDPRSEGYAFVAAGGSTAGPFTARGRILLPPGAAAIVEIEEVRASDITGSGRLVAVAGGLSGALQLRGAATGLLEFDVISGMQRIRANVSARDARFSGPQRISIRRGTFEGTILLDPRGTTVDGTLTGQGIQYGTISLGRVAANVKLRGGSGEVRGSFAGSRGRAFDLQLVAQLSPDRIELVGSGTIDRKPVRLTEPAILTAEDGGWRLRATNLEFAGGNARLAGLFGASRTEIEGNVSRMPLTILDLVNPTLRMGGIATGSFAYRSAGTGQPSGRANLTIRGLSRSGLALSSKPVDVGVAATLTGNRAGARLVAATGGQTIGRAQVQLSNIPGGGDIFSRISRAALFAQVRYNGAADPLWRLTGSDAFSVSGPVAIAADIRGSLVDPSIRGTFRTNAARIESAATGTVLTGVQATGNFNGSRLVIPSFTAATGRSGSVTGSGTVDFAGATPSLDFQMEARAASLLARDEVGATVTGPIRIRSERGSGIVTANVKLDRSSFRLGQARAAAAVPRLNVREINARPDVPLAPAVSLSWRLDITADADNRLMVTGLGIDSEWSGKFDIKGSVDAPVITGRADLVRGGYEFAGKRFDLRRGVIRFQGVAPPDPLLDIVAEGSANDVTATIRVGGTGQRPEIAFTSVPALPQEELLSRLLFGTSITNLSAPEALQLAAAVASLQGGGGLDPINALRRAIGLDRLRIIAADTTTGAGTSIALGKYITRRTYVEIITDGQGYSATRAEFQITRWLSILSTISTIGRQSATVRISRDY